MSELSEKFDSLRSRGEKALVLFVTAGDPDLASLPAILDALADGGADVIEIGIPFSDPIADGPTIQASSQRALDRGITIDQILASIRGCNRVPLVLMGYYNTLLRKGLTIVAGDIVSCGASGVIVCDLTPEESSDWIAASRSTGLDNVFLAAPTSTHARLDLICREATGFVYALSRTGVTGSQNQAADASSLVSRIKSRTSLPVCVGFGISTPSQIHEVCSFADGAVIGSYLVDWLAKNWEGGEGQSALVELVKSWKAATRG